MLRCPKCNRTYQDDMQKFCTHDGGRLVPDIEKPKSFDPNATVTTDGSALDIPPGPPSAPPAFDNLGATMAAPPTFSGSQPSSPTSGIRAPDTSPTTFPETSKIGQDQPDEATVYPALPKPPPPSPPVSVPPPDLQSSAPQAPTVLTAMPPQSTPLPPQVAPVGAASQPLPAQPQSAPLPVAPKKSKTGLALTIVGVLLLIVLVGGGVASYFLFFKQKGPRRGRELTTEPNIKTTGNSNEGPNANNSPLETPKTPPADVPANSIKFENSSASLDGKLAQHYVDFYFYFPKSWQKSAKAGVPGAANFVEVGRILPPNNTQENLTVGWYESKGTVVADLAGNLPAVIKRLDANYSTNLVDYRKVSEGKTTVNGIEGYEFRFLATGNNAEKGDFKIWGRVVYLPPGDEKSTKGVTLYMLTTSLAPELKGVDDVGVKGELPIILNSFTLGKS